MAPLWPMRSADAYLAALGDSDKRVRRQAAAALEVLGDKRAVEPLIALFAHDASPEVRGNAARALGRLGDERAFDLVARAIDDPDHDVRVIAVFALARLDIRRAAEPLRRALRHDDIVAPPAAQAALRDIMDPQSLSALVQQIEEEDIVDET